MIPDLENLLLNGIKEIPPEKLQAFSTSLAATITESLINREKKATLRMSNIGRPCERQLYYEVNSPEDAEVFRPENYMKFMYGHLVEDLMLFLVDLAGHKVEGRQDEHEIEGIKGHRDGVIDGRLVDVKSASKYSFQKFKEHKLPEDDPFGYIGQIQSYLYSSQKDDKVLDKEKASFLVVDKTLGHITLDTYDKDDINFEEVYRKKKEMVQQPEPPPKAYEPVPMGQSGNLVLGKQCSYCPFRNKCWSDANDGKGLRTFLYYQGPVQFVHVEKEPNVPELKSIGGEDNEEKEITSS